MEKLEEAIQQIRENAESITPEDLLVIEAKYEDQKERIKDFVLKARDKFVTKVGPEIADIDLSSEE